MNGMDTLDIDLHLQRPAFALQVQLRLPTQGVTVLWGASGCGKTTLLRCLAGLEHADGHVHLQGIALQDDARGIFMPAWQRRVGLVFQEASLFGHLDVRGNLNYGLRRLPAQAQGTARLALDRAIEVLGIGGLLHRRTGTLSGGERQRVAIARALAMQPRLLLLDEPLAALDAARKREVLPWLNALRQHLQLPVVYVTHAPDEVAHLADTLVVLEQGRVRASGPVQAVLASVDVPVHLGDDVGALVTGTVCGGDAQWGLTRLSLPGLDAESGAALWVQGLSEAQASPVRLRILARDVSVTLTRAQDTSIQNHLPCTIEQIAASADPQQALLRLQAGDTRLLARLTTRAVHQLQLQPGQSVWAQIKAVSLVR